MTTPTIKLFCGFLLARSCRLSLLCTSSSISLFYSHQNLSTLTDADNPNANAHSHYPNLFQEFATTKFNLSSADIAQMFKSNPALENLKTLKIVEQFLDMLKRYGFNQHQIALIMKGQPSCLNSCKEELKVEPKLQLLRDLGFQGEDLAKVVTRSPRIIGTSIQRTLIQNAAFLQDTFKSQNLFIKVVLRKPSILTYDLEKCLKPSVSFLGECGLVGEELSKFILLRPRLLLCTSLTPAKADFLQKIGVDKGSKMYKYFLMMVATSRLENLEAKMDNLEQCGLTVEETIELFGRCHSISRLSQERVRQNMDFIVNDMELPANSVLKRRYLLLHKLKVVKPRVLVLKRIETLNNLGHLDIRRMPSILAMSETNFVKKIIKVHPESKLLNEIYQEALSKDQSRHKELNEKVGFLKM